MKRGMMAIVCVLAVACGGESDDNSAGCRWELGVVVGPVPAGECWAVDGHPDDASQAVVLRGEGHACPATALGNQRVTIQGYETAEVWVRPGHAEDRYEVNACD